MFIKSIQPSFTGLNQLDKKKKQNMGDSQPYSTDLNNLDKKRKLTDMSFDKLEKKKK